MWIEIVVILFLILLNGVFAMYEIALVSSSKARLETLAQQKGGSRAATVLKLLKEPEKILSTIQIGITLIGIVSGAYGGLTLADDLQPLFARIPFLTRYAHVVSVIVVVGVITYLSLIIGELVPKSLALNDPEKAAMSMTPFMVFLTRLSFPFVWLLSVSTRFINRLLGIKTGRERPMSEDELKVILHESAREGIIDKHETEMIREVFRFGDKKADEVMRHRRDVVCMYTSYSKEKVVEVIREGHYSRYLLCEDDSEDILGTVAVKDIVLLLEESAPFDLRKVAVPPVYIPENVSAVRVLDIFRKNRTNFGVVVDEYGDMEGIVTLNDLAESILGDVPEAGDAPAHRIVTRQDGSWLVDGGMEIDDFMDAMDVVNYPDLESLDIHTLSGLAMYELGRVPAEGDLFDYRNFHFEVVDMKGTRVDKLLVTRKAPAAE